MWRNIVLGDGFVSISQNTCDTQSIRLMACSIVFENESGAKSRTAPEEINTYSLFETGAIRAVVADCR